MKGELITQLGQKKSECAVELGCELRQSNLRYSSIREQFVCGFAQQL